MVPIQIDTEKERLEREIAERKKLLEGIREIAQHGVHRYGSGQSEQKEKSGSHDLALDLPSGIQVREEDSWTMNGGCNTITVYYDPNGEQRKKVLVIAERKVVFADNSPDWQKAMRDVIARWPKILANFELEQKKAKELEKQEEERRAREANEWRQLAPLRKQKRDLGL